MAYASGGEKRMNKSICFLAAMTLAALGFGPANAQDTVKIGMIMSIPASSPIPARRSTTASSFI